MRYTTILWDFDGTLADTLPIALEVFNAMAARHGFRPVEDPGAVRALSTRAFLRSHGISLARLPLLMRELLAGMAPLMGGARLFPGIPEVLHTLSERGVRLGILSSGSRENIMTCLRARGVEGLFGLVAGYSRLLGKGRGIRRILREGGLSPRELLYVGDEVRDIEASHKAGVDVAAVTWGLHARELLGRHRPTWLIDQPGQLLEAVG